MKRLIRVNFSTPTERNAWFLVLEIFFATFLGAAASFNTAFAIRLGATDRQVGWLTALPALFAILVAIPSGRFLNRRKNQKSWILGSLAIYRTGFLMVAIIPFLKFAGVSQGALLIFWLVILSIPAHFFNVGFLPMLSETIPERDRANVFTWRNVIYNATLSVCVYGYGQWLNRIQFPVNYQVMYAVSYFAALLSLFFLVKIQVPQKPLAVTQATSRKPLHELIKDVQSNLKIYTDYVAIVRNTVLHAVGLWIISPLYMLYFVRELEANDAWIGIQASVASVAAIVGFIVWRKWMSRLGESKTLKITIILAGLYPVLVGLTHNLNIILVWVAINGLISGGISLSHLNTLLRVMPEGDRPGYTAIYMTITSIGVFICPLAGVWLAGHFGYPTVLVTFGLLSILGSFSFWIWPVKSSPQTA
jgi:MFS family permease